MFTGIIEDLGVVRDLVYEGSNLHIRIESIVTPELKIDQSVAHNGVCLTVVSIDHNEYTVTAIQETLEKSNIQNLEIGDSVNLERAMKMNARLDGHIVQGHVDQTATCLNIEDLDGSWVYTFEYDPGMRNITIEKGSITVNGVSLTVLNSETNRFSVAIIPYTYENTNFYKLKKGDVVNLEFDVIGKYVKKLFSLSHSN